MSSTQTQRHEADSPGATVSQWLAAIAQPERLEAFRSAYGGDEGLIEERARLARRVLDAFGRRFGDVPVRLFRAPGRINLRGMHVDTHGGFLNLMTHQREVMAVAAPANSPVSLLCNANPDFGEVKFDLDREGGPSPVEADWFNFISHPDIRGRVARRRDSEHWAWANYLIGAALRVRHARPDMASPGLLIMVDSDLPSGAALSSSAALSLAALLAYGARTTPPLTLEELIRAEQDVEWYAGARVGMSDQSAILLGRPGMILHLAVFAEDFSLEGARHLPFPDDLALLVINSYTSRALSGAQLVQYTLNRFAYSMALTVLRAEMVRAGWAAGAVARMDRLARLTPDALGGDAAVYDLLRGVPEFLSLDVLRERYAPPDLDAAYDRYFGGAPEAERPTEIPLRGPLLFGIAESERARLFPDLLLRGDYAQAGALMRIGHDGDRVRRPGGGEFTQDVSDAALSIMARKGLPVSECPGRYGASSPALDMLVDAALDGGALGASLTGAGLAGAVLALCRAEDAAAVASRLQACLRDTAYAHAAGWASPPEASALAQAVVVNRAVAGAGELVLS